MSISYCWLTEPKWLATNSMCSEVDGRLCGPPISRLRTRRPSLSERWLTGRRLTRGIPWRSYCYRQTVNKWETPLLAVSLR